MKAILVIDMPKGCCECNCAIDLCHGTIPSQEWYNKRPSWCPLRPIPDKAGERLIEGLDRLEEIKNNVRVSYVNDLMGETENESNSM